MAPQVAVTWAYYKRWGVVRGETRVVALYREGGRLQTWVPEGEWITVPGSMSRIDGMIDRIDEEEALALARRMRRRPRR